MKDRNRTCESCGRERKMKGFRQGVCKGCFIERLEKVPPERLPLAIHMLTGTVPTQERSRAVHKLLFS